MGEMGGVFARGILRSGHPVIPFTRGQSLTEIEQFGDKADLILVAVGENDLNDVLKTLPTTCKSNLALLQNELLPANWQVFDVTDPTVISVWFEKKQGQDYKIIQSSPVYGPQAQLLIEALRTMQIPAHRVADEKALLYQLILKNLYILTTNIAGLIVEGDVETLWNQHQSLARQLRDEIMDIQDRLTNSRFDREQLWNDFRLAVEGDPLHKCLGRSAGQRLNKAIQHADSAGLAIPTLRDIYAQQK